MSSSAGGNGGNDIDRRMAFLEKVYIEDRERWRRSEARADKHEKVLVMLLKQLQKDRKESEERWQKSAERWQKNDERIDAMLKILRRRMDG